MLSTLKNVFKIGELRHKIFFTFVMFFFFRLGANIPVPGVDAAAFAQLVEQNQLFGFYNIISGGSFSAFTIFAMSITPYINASIIMQLMTVVIPKLEKLSKEGEEGRKKITQYTRYLTVVLAFVQAIGTVAAVDSALTNPGFGSYLIVALAITGGTTLLMWMGEQITEKGIGNGISLIIFAGIVSQIPGALGKLWNYLNMDNSNIGIFDVLILLVVIIAVVACIVFVQQGQRRIPVQYAKRVVGRRVYGGQSTHLPLRVNQAGVIPIIFASSILMLPEQIAYYFQEKSSIARWFYAHFGWNDPANVIVYALLIIGFTYFYTAIVTNPSDMAENIKKYGGFIPGIRPGRPTADYIAKVMGRITLAGAVFLALIAIIPNQLVGIIGFEDFKFGGTSVLIAVGVALDTMKQIESHMLMRSYEGFIK